MLIDNKIEPVGYPQISGVVLKEGVKPFIFEATVEIRPQVSVKDYKGIEVESVPYRTN